MTMRCGPALITALVMVATGSNCSRDKPHPLADRSTVSMRIGPQVFKLWVARTFAEQSQGLMRITEEQMTPLPDGTERGMLFVFDHSVRDSFWMKNTIIELDIAYVATDGTVVATYTMAPLDTRNNQYPPNAPYRYAIETRAHRLKALGIAKGAVLKIPASVLKGPS